MNFSITKVDQITSQAVRNTYSAQLAQRQADLVRRVDAFATEVKRGRGIESGELMKFASHKQEIETLILQVPLYDEQGLFELEYQDLVTSLDEVISQWPQEIKLTQEKARYYRQPDDNLSIGIRKAAKRSLFVVTKLPRKVANGFRKILGKPTKAVKYNTHTVPLKWYGEIYLKEELIRRLLGQSYAWMRLEARVYEMLFAIEDKLTSVGDATTDEVDMSVVHQHINEQYQIINKGVDDIVTKVVSQFELNYSKAGTFELKSGELTSARASIKAAQNRKTLASMAKGWRTTHQTLLEDWRFNVQLHRMVALVRHEYITLEERITEKKATITESFSAINVYLTDAKKRAAKDSPVGELRKLLVKEKYEATKSLDHRLLKSTIEALINQNFAALVHRLDTKLNELYLQLPEKTAILKSGTYDVPIKASDLLSFSPQELFAFESIPAFEKATAKLLQLITRKIDELIATVNDLDDIVAFCLDSAMASLEQEDADPAESLQVYQEGLDRAINKLAEGGQQLEQLKSTIIDESKEAVEALVAQITELTSNDNTRELNMRISKGKALRSKDQFMENARSMGGRLNKRFTVKTLRIGQQISRFTSSLQSSIAASSGEKKVSSEVSDFLADSFSRVNELPIVYQRLYKISALTDQGLFEGRSGELFKLKSSYQSWEVGKHAPTVIVGEKWSGLTSLINHFLDKQKPKLSVIRIDHQQNISTDAELLAVFSTYLKAEFSTAEEVINHLHGLSAKKIVVVENLQFFFLRKVKGFQALKILFKIMAETDQQVFWLVSCTEYGWNYLDATNAARDHFRHLILMEPIANDQMVELIMKRNRISGYRVEYEVTHDLAKSKKFNRLNHEQQQKQLKALFFNNLIKFSKSNVSLGLIFWLLSTKKISEDTITIGSFKEPDLSFLKQLSMPKVFILNNLILHDGLTINQLSEVMRMGETAVQALVTNLEDDGVLIIKDQHYLINPFIYRQIVNHLKLKNLIH